MRISATTLESFRLYLDPANEWFTEDKMLATIKGEVVDTPEMALGRAFESVLMDPDRYRVANGFLYADYTFSDATMARPLALVDRRGVFQVKTTKRYGAVDVVSKADQLLGAQIHEWKTTQSTFDAEKYLASYQQRFMLDAFEAALVTYHVFSLDDHGNGVVEVRDIHTLNVFPYAALHQDCCELLAAFVDYVTTQRLDGLLRARQVAAA